MLFLTVQHKHLDGCTVDASTCETSSFSVLTADGKFSKWRRERTFVLIKASLIWRPALCVTSLSSWASSISHETVWQTLGSEEGERNAAGHMCIYHFKHAGRPPSLELQKGNIHEDNIKLRFSPRWIRRHFIITRSRTEQFVQNHIRCDIFNGMDDFMSAG